MNFSRKRQTVTHILSALLFLLALFPGRLAAGALTLAWDPNTEGDLAGYKVYYGTRSGDYDFVIDVGNVTDYTVTGLEPETPYYLALTAYDTSWNESDFSAEISAVTDSQYRLIFGLGETSGGWMEAFAGDYSHAGWLRVSWGVYNSANGEARIATGDIDGDGKEEIVVGLAPVPGDSSIPGGYFELLDDDHSHLGWGRINWSVYNSTSGESWPACGDVDGDGIDEIIIGFGSGGGGYFEVFDYAGGIVSHKQWGRVHWNDYNTSNGEGRPACGDVDGDGVDEIVMGLGSGGGGYFELFGYDAGIVVHEGWGRVHWTAYNTSYGETRPACGDVDGDGVDEIVMGFVSGGEGYFEVFDYVGGIVNHKQWGRVHWTDYNVANGETWPAVKK